MYTVAHRKGAFWDTPPATQPFVSLPLVMPISDSIDVSVRYFRITGGILIAAALAVVLYAISRSNYLLFHALVELFAIAVAWSVFILVWNARTFIRNDALVLLGTAYLFTGCLDLLHTLAYKGMGVFPSADAANLATQFWIAGRAMEAISLLLFAIVTGREQVRLMYALAGYGITTAVTIAAILSWRIFPDCFAEGTGLTSFKIGSEYLIVVVLLAAATILYHKRHFFDGWVLMYLLGAMGITATAEMAFTLYDDVHGVFNMVGHFLKVASYFLIYAALIHSGLKRPYSLLYRELAQKDATLHTTLEEHRTILNHIPDFVALLNTDLTVVWANHRALAPRHFSAVEVTGRPCYMIWGERQTACRACPVVQSLQTGQPQSAILERPAGRFWHIRGVPIRNEQGEIIRILDIAEDITERRQIELELAHSEARYRSIVETAEEGIWMLDDHGQTRFVNPKMAEMLGYEVHEMIGRLFTDFMPPEEVPIAQAYLELRRQGVREQHDARLRRRDDRDLWVIVNTNPYFDEQGQFTGVLGMLTDISERKYTEQQLQNAHARYQAVVNDQTELICRFTANGILTFVNQAYCRYFNIREDTLIGKSFYALIAPEDCAAAQERIASLNIHHPLTTHEARVLNADGRRRWMEWTDRAIVDNQGKICEYQRVGRDITEQRHLERHLVNASEREQRRLGCELHDGLCQDLKSIEFEIALMRSRMTRHGNVDPHDLHYLDVLEERVNQTVRTAYTIARGLLPIDPQRRHLGAALTRLAETARLKTSARILLNSQKHLAVASDLAAHHLFRIAQEALANALQHGQATQIEIEWRRDDDHACLSIIDNGQGLPHASLNNHGMGLAVMQARARAIDAELTISSLPEGGVRVFCRMC